MVLGVYHFFIILLLPESWQKVVLLEKMSLFKASAMDFPYHPHVYFVHYEKVILLPLRAYMFA